MKYVLIVSFALPLSSGVAYAENQDAGTVLAVYCDEIQPRMDHDE